MGKEQHTHDTSTVELKRKGWNTMEAGDNVQTDAVRQQAEEDPEGHVRESEIIGLEFGAYTVCERTVVVFEGEVVAVVEEDAEALDQTEIVNNVELGAYEKQAIMMDIFQCRQARCSLDHVQRIENGVELSIWDRIDERFVVVAIRNE